MTSEKNYDDTLNNKKNLFETFKTEMGITILVIYTVLLSIAAIAELFEIQSILDWWIFRPPGK